MKKFYKFWCKLPRCWCYKVATGNLQFYRVHYILLFGRKWEVFIQKLNYEEFV
jgi:hypothetical protein